MRIVVMAQEEPVYMGPYLQRVMTARRRDIVALAIAPVRGVAGKPPTLRERLEQFHILWLILEPSCFLRSLAVKAGWALTRKLGPIGTPLDDRSLDRHAERLGIPVLRFENPNSPAFIEKLKALAPDIVFNQSELLLRKAVLAVPRIGFVNRHGSLLPMYRGRVGSFWAHACGEQHIGVTVHFVDTGVDSGMIIHQEAFPTDPRLPYGRIMERLFQLSPGVVLRGLERLERPDFTPLANDIEAGSLHKFPTLAEARLYRRMLAERRLAPRPPARPLWPAAGLGG